MKKSRKKRSVIRWQTKDQGADPLTERGKKWIQREIQACDTKKLRKQLESQIFEEKEIKAFSYWDWMEQHGYTDTEGNSVEPYQANPDRLSDEDIT